jgi:hypothetical protein
MQIVERNVLTTSRVKDGGSTFPEESVNFCQIKWLLISEENGLIQKFDF